MKEKRVNPTLSHSRWGLITIVGIALLLAACDNGGSTSPAGQAALAPVSAASTGSSSAPAVATAYWPNGKPNIPAAPVIPPAPALPSSNSKLLFSDDFSNPSVNHYTILDLGQPANDPTSTWQVKDGRFTQQGDSAGNPASYETVALSGESSWQDYRIEVQAYSGATPLGLVARYSTMGFYRLRVNRSGVTGSGWQLDRYDNSGHSYKITNLAQGGIGLGYQRQQWNYLALTVQGSTISVNINGQTVASVTDASHAAGSIGLYTEATGGAYFDNLRVEQQ